MPSWVIAAGLIASIGDPGGHGVPKGGTAENVLVERCADDPSQFHVKRLFPEDVATYVALEDAPGVHVSASATSFELSGTCDRTIKSLIPVIRLSNGRWLVVSEPPLELLPTKDPDTAGPYLTGDVQSIPRNLRSIGVAGVDLSLRTVVDLPAGRMLGLWSDGKASMIGVLACDAMRRCSSPDPLLTSRYFIEQMDFLPSPDRPGSGGVSVWAHIGPDHDALLSFRLSY